MRRAQRRKFHYLYKTTCKITNRYYYGMHSTDDLDDGYLGSGKRLRYSINKYGEKNHVCEKLKFFETREKLKEEEAKLVNEKILQDPNCMNIARGGQGGILNEEHGKKFHAAGGAKVNVTIRQEKHLEKLKNFEYKQNWIKSISKAQLGEKNHFYGKTHSEETKAKMRSAHKKRRENT